MASVESELFISAAPTAPGAWLGFGEPDWLGDSDYPCRGAEADLDGRALALEADIEVALRGGRLDDYYVRRARFELQSIRVQIDRDRRAAFDGPLPPRRLAAILSRMDRLGLCIEARRVATD